VGPGARFRGVGSGSCRFGSVGGSVSGVSGSVELRATTGSAKGRSGARFGRVGARFRDAPARSAVWGSRSGGDASATLLGTLTDH
jgi:hypothetical protein